MNNLTNIKHSDELLEENSLQHLYLYFKLGVNHYAINIENVLEVMKLPVLDYPQKLPNNVIGLLNYNDSTINILDVRMYLNLSIKPYDTSNKLIILNYENIILGLIVDDINDIISINEFKKETSDPQLDNNIIESMFYVENQAVSVINIEALTQILKSGCKNQNIDIETLYPKDEFSQEILQKRTKNLITRSKIYSIQNLYSQNKFITFMLNKNKYCIKLSYIKEVSQRAGIINIPCAPDYIEGLTTLRGDFITIINLKKFLNLSNKTYNEQSKVIIIEAENYKLGFLTDKIIEISDIPDEIIQTAKTNENSYIISEPIINENLVQILNMEKILTDEKLYIDEE